jgi:hypothetical protein
VPFCATAIVAVVKVKMAVATYLSMASSEGPALWSNAALAAQFRADLRARSGMCGGRGGFNYRRKLLN